MFCMVDLERVYIVCKTLEIDGVEGNAFVSCHLRVTDAYIATTLDVHVQQFRQQ